MKNSPHQSPETLPHQIFFRALLDSLNSCTAITDFHGHILALNRNWETYPHENPFVTGLVTGSDFLGTCRTLAASGRADLSSIASAVLEIASGNQGRLSCDYSIQSRDQTHWYGLVAIRCSPDSGLGLVVHNIDITEKMDIKARLQSTERERALMEIRLRHGQKMEAIGQLSAGIAHEINTPMQYINDNLRFLEDSFIELCEALSKETDFLKAHQEASPTSAEIQDLLEWIQSKDLDYLLLEVPKALRQSAEGLERVSTIVRAMKAFSHPGTEGRALMNLNQAIDTTLLVAKNEWKFVAEVEKEFDPDLPLVDCYPGEINQVFLNLMINAAHAIADRVGDSGGLGCIRIQARRMDDQVEVRVSDTGTGIPEKIRDQIFLPFFTTKAVGRGSGQGLSIVHSVIAKHGGSVSFETEIGKGTCFIVKLPIHQPSGTAS